MNPGVDRASQQIVFRELEEGDVSAVAALRDRVLAHLTHPDDYVPHEEEDAFLGAHLGNAGVCLGIEVDGRLVGFSALTFDIERAHLDVELRDAILKRDARRAQTCVLAVTMLDPGFRGMGLHRKAIDLRLGMARRRGWARAVAIASPSNVSSLCNLLRQGGRVEEVLDFGNARVRYLISLSPSQRRSGKPMPPATLVPVGDPERVRSLLGQGHIGEEVVLINGLPHFRLEPTSEDATR